MDKYGPYLCIGVIALGISMMALGFMDWSLVVGHLPIPQHVILWLHVYAKFFGGFLILLGLGAGVVRRSRVEERLDSWLGTNRRAELLLACIVAIYILTYAGFTCYRHYTFNSAGYDLGLQDQVVWNTSQGRLFAGSIEPGNPNENYLGDHFQPLMGLLALPYLLYPSVYWLLIFQSVCLGCGAIPLFQIARRELQSSLAGLVFAMAYCFYPALGYVNRFDFHFEVVFVPSFLMAWNALTRGRQGIASLWLGVAILGKEELGLTIAMAALIVALRIRYRWFGLAWFVVGVAFSLTALFVLIPAFRGSPSDTLGRYGWLGSTPIGMLWTVLSRPGYVLGKVQEIGWFHMMAQLFAPVALLNLLSPAHFLMLLPALAYNLLSGFEPQHTTYYQYMVPIIPLVFIGALYGLSNLTRTATQHLSSILPNWNGADYRFVGLALLLAAGVFSFWFDNPIRDGIVPAAWDRLPNEQIVRQLIATLPNDVALVTTNYYTPHLSHRQLVYVYYPPTKNTSSVLLADMVFFNLSDRRDASDEDYQLLLEVCAQEGFGLVHQQDGVVILQREGGSYSELQRLLKGMDKQ
jgi:uncharacterized membrane protein